MKQTDYCPRAAFMDIYLMDKISLIGAEIGVDAGAHAEAMFTYLDIQKLYLIDTWEKEWVKGYCEGRLTKWKSKTEFIKQDGTIMPEQFNYKSLDFAYIDITHDHETVKKSLNVWFYVIKTGGILGYRNYTTCQKAIDEFVTVNGIKTKIDNYHNEIVMFK
jgi:hypothetical protein